MIIVKYYSLLIVFLLRIILMIENILIIVLYGRVLLVLYVVTLLSRISWRIYFLILVVLLYFG